MLMLLSHRMYYCAIAVLLAQIWIGTVHSETTENITCHLHALNEEVIYNTIQDHKARGAHSITFNLVFPRYTNGNPLLNRTKVAYKTNKWQRLFTKQGETLLSLPFDYTSLSLTLLGFGVEDEIDVELVDVKEWCLSSLDESSKLDVVKKLLALDFRAHEEGMEWLKQDQFCHQVIVGDEGNALFVDECCHFVPYGSGFSCEVVETNRWIDYLYTVINIMDVVFFLFGPLIVQQMFASNSYRITQYLVKLDDPHTCFMRKVKDDEVFDIENTNNNNADSENGEGTPLRGYMVEENTPTMPPIPRSYAACVAKLPYNINEKVKMSTLYIQVDHRQLMAEEEVNVGMFMFLWQHIILCKISHYYPLKACCFKSFFGSWKMDFIRWKIPNNSISKFCLNLSVRFGKSLTWKSIFRVVGLILAVVLIPFPFYLRTVLYKSYQSVENAHRMEYTERMGLNILSRSVFQFQLGTLHALLIFSLVVYFITALVLLLIYRLDKIRFTDHITQMLQDLKHIERLQSLRLYAMHIVKPFEIFGPIGVIIAPVYWTIILPIVTIIVIFYCIPTFYLLGRFLFNSEMLVRLRPQKVGTLEFEPDTFANIFMTQYISPPSESTPLIRPMKIDGKWSKRITPRYPWSFHLPIGLLMCIWMISLLVLYAECFRFLFEVMALTLMGALVNAGSAGQYFMLAFFLVTYILDVFNNHKSKYLKLSAKVFEYIKAKLDARVLQVIRLRGSEQMNVAFKFFSNSELEKIYAARGISDLSSYDADTVSPEYIHFHKDRFDFVKAALCWRLNSLIYFIDKLDQPRIPKALFESICDLKLDGLPGPVYGNLLISLRQLLYMVIILIFVFLVVLAFGDSYDLSTTNQLLLTLVGGLIPFIVIRVMKPNSVELNLNTYSFQGKIYEVIHSFQQFWPAYDLAFDLCPDHEEEKGPPAQPETGKPGEGADSSIVRLVEPLITHAANAEPELEPENRPEVKIIKDRVCGLGLEQYGNKLVLHVKGIEKDQGSPVDDCIVS